MKGYKVMENKRFNIRILKNFLFSGAMIKIK